MAFTPGGILHRLRKFVNLALISIFWKKKKKKVGIFGYQSKTQDTESNLKCVVLRHKDFFTLKASLVLHNGALFKNK